MYATLRIFRSLTIKLRFWSSAAAQLRHTCGKKVFFLKISRTCAANAMGINDLAVPEGVWDTISNIAIKLNGLNALCVPRHAWDNRGTLAGQLFTLLHLNHTAAISYSSFGVILLDRQVRTSPLRECICLPDGGLSCKFLADFPLRA